MLKLKGRTADFYFLKQNVFQILEETAKIILVTPWAEIREQQKKLVPTQLNCKH